MKTITKILCLPYILLLALFLCIVMLFVCLFNWFTLSSIFPVNEKIDQLSFFEKLLYLPKVLIVITVNIFGLIINTAIYYMHEGDTDIFKMYIHRMKFAEE